jgi:hypothetical protein
LRAKLAGRGVTLTVLVFGAAKLFPELGNDMLDVPQRSGAALAVTGMLWISQHSRG